MECSYGGTQPVATRFWPPIIPECPEVSILDNTIVEKIYPREEYNNLIELNSGLTVMPRSLREDLPLLSHEKKQEFNISLFNSQNKNLHKIIMFGDTGVGKT